MKSTNKIVVAVLIIAILMIAVGYAAIANITLKISGEVSADPSDENFKVAFSGTPTVSDDTKVTAAVTDNLNATLNVTGLTAKGDTATATYTIQNTSKDLSAALSATVTNTNSSYFDVQYSFESESIAKGAATTLTVTVELLQTPVEDTVTSTVGIQIKAEPVQPQA